ncbi:hypothetical protein H0W80_04875 [Candidatus Saccharibacteria bacterium]|nr:hypothetical protein [Candidatus Saccharibacteria bacterium]
MPIVHSQQKVRFSQRRRSRHKHREHIARSRWRKSSYLHTPRYQRRDFIILPDGVVINLCTEAAY